MLIAVPNLFYLPKQAVKICKTSTKNVGKLFKLYYFQYFQKLKEYYQYFMIKKRLLFIVINIFMTL